VTRTQSAGPISCLEHRAVCELYRSQNGCHAVGHRRHGRAAAIVRSLVLYCMWLAVLTSLQFLTVTKILTVTKYSVTRNESLAVTKYYVTKSSDPTLYTCTPYITILGDE